MFASWCLGCVVFRVGKICVTKCWRFGGVLLRCGNKYVLLFCLCEGGCFVGVVGVEFG